VASNTAKLVKFMFTMDMSSDSGKSKDMSMQHRPQLEFLKNMGVESEKMRRGMFNFANSFKSMTGALSTGFSSLFGLIAKFIPALSLVSMVMEVINFQRDTVQKLALSVDTTKNSLNAMSGTVLGLAADMSVLSSDRGEIVNYMIEIQKWGGIASDQLYKTTKAVINMSKMTGLSASEAADVTKRYGEIFNVYGSVENAANSLGATLSAVSKNYGISSAELIQGLSSVELTLIKLNNTQRAQAIPGMLKYMGVMKELGISASESAQIVNNLSEITSESGAKMRAAMMAFSGMGAGMLKGMFAGQGGGAGLSDALYKTVNSPQVKAMMRVSVAKTAEMLGMSPETLKNLSSADPRKFKEMLEKQKKEAKEKEAYENAKKQFTMTMPQLLDKLVQQINALLIMLGNELIPFLIPLLKVLSFLVGAFMKFWNVLKWVIVIGVGIAAIMGLLAGLPATLVGAIAVLFTVALAGVLRDVFKLFAKLPVIGKLFGGSDKEKKEEPKKHEVKDPKTARLENGPKANVVDYKAMTPNTNPALIEKPTKEKELTGRESMTDLLKIIAKNTSPQKGVYSAY